MTTKNTYSTGPHFHLVNAMYNWIVENGGVPHIAVPFSEVPPQIHRLGDAATQTIVLNIAPHSVGAFSLEPDMLSFRARFQGADTQLHIRTDQIKFIFDRDTPAVQMVLPDVTPVEANEPPEPVAKRPSLSVVK